MSEASESFLEYLATNPAVTPAQSLANLITTVFTQGPVSDFREHKSKEIDATTARLIAKGFMEYPAGSGQFFSLSTTAQFNTLVMYTRRNDPSFVYPVLRTTANNAAVVSLGDAAAIEGFYICSESAVRTLLEAGTQVKQMLNALNTPQEILSFVDPRT